MTTYYVDLENGIDANNGLSFANRKKTFGFTSGLLAGDTVRVMKSPDATTLTSGASITAGGSTMTLGAVINDTIDQCESGWTGTANVTVTHTTTAKQGTNAVSISVGTTFTTGLAAFKALPSTLNPTVSGGISFWIRQASGTVGAANSITIKLCSDGVGAVPISVYNIPALSSSTGNWHAMKIPGAPASGINSVAFYVNTDNGAQTFLIDNIITYDVAPNDLTLASMISPTNSNWLPIKSIVSGIVTFDCGTNSVPTELGYYDGATNASFAPYKLETIKSAVVAANVAALGNITSNGTSSSVFTVSGGWNSTDMTTQTGATYVDGTAGTGIALSVSGSYLYLSGINVSRFGMGIAPAAGLTCTDSNISAQAIANQTHGLQVSASSSNFQRTTFSVDLNYNSCVATVNGGPIGYTAGNTTPPNNNFIQANNVISNNLYTLYVGAPSTTSTTDMTACDETIIIYNARYNQRGLCLPGFTNSLFQILSYKDQIGTTYPFLMFGNGGTATTLPVPGGSAPKNNQIQLGTIGLTTLTTAISLGAGQDNEIDFTSATITGTPTNLILATGAGKTYVIGADLNALGYSVVLKSHELIMVGSTLNYPTKLTLDTYGQFDTSRIAFQNYAGTANDCRIYSPVGTVLTDTTTTVSGRSWKITPVSTANLVTATNPLILPLGEAYVTAGTLVTLTVQVLRAASTQYVKFFVEGGNAKDPINSTPEVTLSGGTAGSWGTMTLTFTPTRAGVAKINIGVYNAPSTSVYVDALTVSQA